MHPNPIFHTETADRNLDWARARAFGVLAVNGPEGPLLSHVSFLLDADGKTVWLHLVRSNPIVRALNAGAQPARIAVSGPDSYISPDWYGVEDQVPTWNYVAVHLAGPLELCPQDDLHAILDRESALFEQRLLPKTPWTSDKMSDGVMERMMRAIVPCRMAVAGVDGTWKFSQNKSESARLRAADHVEAHGLGTGLSELAEMMRAADGQR